MAMKWTTMIASVIARRIDAGMGFSARAKAAMTAMVIPPMRAPMTASRLAVAMGSFKRASDAMMAIMSIRTIASPTAFQPAAAMASHSKRGSLKKPAMMEMMTTKTPVRRAAGSLDAAMVSYAATWNQEPLAMRLVTMATPSIPMSA